MTARNKIFLISTVFAALLLATQTRAAFIFDLENLRSQDSFLTKAYDVIKVQNAWEFLKNSAVNLSPVRIGIVDTGVDMGHQEFNNPKVDFGSSATTALIDSDAPKGHGTQVAGIIGANNVVGAGGFLSGDSKQMNGIVSGILKENQYKLEIENYRIATTTQSSGVFAALEKVLKRNPTIVNMSFGAPKCSAISLVRRKLLELEECYTTDADFIDAFGVYTKVFNAPENQGTLFVAAAGNWDIDTRSNVLPATIRLPNLISIGATGLEDERATFIALPFLGAKSNFGSDVEISAPGVGVYAPKPGNLYEDPRGIDKKFNGTSAATPMVTGVAAILKALEPEYQKYTPGLAMSPGKIKEVLVKSADPIQTGEPDKRIGTGCYADPNDPVLTGCRLNAHRAVAWYLI